MLEYMKKMITERGFPPTVRDICSDLDIKSTSTVHSDLKVLEEKGLIKRDPNRQRAIVLLENDEPVLPHANKKNVAANTTTVEDINTVIVPVIGRVAAGQPILANENIDDEIPIPARFAGKGTNFILTVHGCSMINAGINDGDYLLVQETSDAVNGEIVVAMIDGEYEPETTVKRFYRESGHIRLQPENDEMEPIIVDNCEIVGKVKAVFRYLN